MRVSRKLPFAEFVARDADCSEVSSKFLHLFSIVCKLFNYSSSAQNVVGTFFSGTRSNVATQETADRALWSILSISIFVKS